MKSATKTEVKQPVPFTPGLTGELVRAHAYQMFRDKLERESLSLEDWVLAEKDLVQEMQATEG